MLYSGLTLGTLTSTYTDNDGVGVLATGPVTATAAPWATTFSAAVGGQLVGHSSSGLLPDFVSVTAAAYTTGAAFALGTAAAPAAFIGAAPAIALAPFLVLTDNVAPLLAAGAAFNLTDQVIPVAPAAAATVLCCANNWITSAYLFSSGLGATADLDGTLVNARRRWHRHHVLHRCDGARCRGHSEPSRALRRLAVLVSPPACSTPTTCCSSDLRMPWVTGATRPWPALDPTFWPRSVSRTTCRRQWRPPPLRRRSQNQTILNAASAGGHLSRLQPGWCGGPGGLLGCSCAGLDDPGSRDDERCGYAVPVGSVGGDRWHRQHPGDDRGLYYCAGSPQFWHSTRHLPVQATCVYRTSRVRRRTATTRWVER